MWEKDFVFYGLCMDVFGFDGFFLLLVLDMFEDLLEGLCCNYVICMFMIVEMEKLFEIFVWLNVKYGFNIE